MLNRMFSAQQQMPVIIEEPPPNMPALPGFMNQSQGLPQVQPTPEPASATGSSADSGSGFLGGWFGGGKKKEPAATSSGSETKILESFDAPPVPSFEYK